MTNGINSPSPLSIIETESTVFEDASTTKHLAKYPAIGFYYEEKLFVIDDIYRFI
jgi:hypothetical protein